MTMFQAAIQKGDHNAAATASGRLLQVLGTIGRLSGELATYAGGGGTNIVNNTLVINSPAFAKLQATVISALAPYPEARLADRRAAQRRRYRERNPGSATSRCCL